MVASESWTMPFSKGDYPNSESKKIITLLHETGRITRQEAVSMLPPVVTRTKNDDLVMDTCAAPGSKATQLAEAVPNGLVLANEPSSGRLNLLTTNRGRLGIENMLIMQHDGRHIGRMPEPGVDGVVVERCLVVGLQPRERTENCGNLGPQKWAVVYSNCNQILQLVQRNCCDPEDEWFTQHAR